MSSSEVPEDNSSLVDRIINLPDWEPEVWSHLLSFLNEHYRPEDPDAPRIVHTESITDWRIEGDIIELRMPNSIDYMGCIAYNPVDYVFNTGHEIYRYKVMEVTLLCVNSSLRGEGWAKRLIAGVRHACAQQNIQHAIFNGPAVGKLLFPHAKIMALSLQDSAGNFDCVRLERACGQSGAIITKGGGVGASRREDFFARALREEDVPWLAKAFSDRAEEARGFRRVFSEAEIKDRFMRPHVTSWIILESDGACEMRRPCGFVSCYAEIVEQSGPAVIGEPQRVARIYYSIPVARAKLETIKLFVLLAKTAGCDAVVAPSTGWHTEPLLRRCGFWPARDHLIRGEFLTPMPSSAIGYMRGFECHTL